MRDRAEIAELFDEFPELKVIARLLNRYLALRGVSRDNLRFVDRLAVTVALMENDRELKMEE